MLPQFDRDVFDISPDKIAKVDNLHIPDLPMLHFPQNLTQNKKYSYHVTYHVTPKSFEQFLQYKNLPAAARIELVSESPRNGQNRYRNRIMPIPGISIGIGIGPVLDKVSVSELEPNILLYQFKSGPILCKYRYKRSLLSYLWTSPYKGKGINIRIYQ